MVELRELDGKVSEVKEALLNSADEVKNYFRKIPVVVIKGSSLYRSRLCK